MRLEEIPVLLGVLVAVLGIAFVVDAVLPDVGAGWRERRRRIRAERHRVGEALVGLGTLGVSLALFGRDTWHFGTLSVLGAAVLLGVGAWLNREYLRELVSFRGAARRAEPGALASRTAGARRAGAAGRGVERERPIPTSTEGVPPPAEPGEREAPEPGRRPRIR